VERFRSLVGHGFIAHFLIAPMIRLNYLISSLNQVSAAKPGNGTAACNYNCMDNLPLTAAGRMRFALAGLRLHKKQIAENPLMSVG